MEGIASASFDSPKRELFDLESELLNSLTPVTSYSRGSTTSADSTPSQESPEPTSEKKPVKKRKSWGQELPTPTTNLPPRKRAKTEAEKEQRRIERVLRNRAAAQSSRERKRKEVEALEDVKNNLADTNTSLQQDNANLQKRLEAVLAQNQLLQIELQKLKDQMNNSHNNMSFKSEYNSSPLLQPLLTPVSVTHDTFSMSPSGVSSPATTDGTLDPSNLSTPSKLEESPYSLTQHTAVMLCSRDLPCQLIGRSLQCQIVKAMKWIAYLVLAILHTPLLEMICLATNLQIPDQVLFRLSRLTILSASQKTILPQLVCRFRTLSPTCALLMDATSSVRWFESKASKELLSTWVAKLDELDESEAQDPVQECRKFVVAMERYNGSGTKGVSLFNGLSSGIYRKRCNSGILSSEEMEDFPRRNWADLDVWG
ncbi:hypothetical protein DFH27DRAFT_135709 [Peziza echinospora]|nr:hypothetical protein DFH27DRAFT_135709 [Peziza echinospora]